MINEKIEDNVVIATFEGGKTNPVDLETLRQLRAIVKKVNEEDELKGLVCTGAGRTFSSGFDLSMFLGFKDLDEVITFFNEAEETFIEFFMCKKPVVSAINGAAVAGGLILSMASDYRIVKNHPKIKLGMSEIKIGLGLSLVQTEIMKFGLDSVKKFRDIMYFGEMFDVNKALELEIADELAEEDVLISRAIEVVKGWIDCPGRAFMMLKHSLRKPTEDLMRHRLKNENWQDAFNVFFDPGTRGALEMVLKMMG
ncbi:MAG: enoyl-CoA hydratase/isomerase family protein [bacterium]|nr:enoyl-CoA hydratase/isomerase family protein [bacterium]